MGKKKHTLAIPKKGQAPKHTSVDVAYDLSAVGYTENRVDPANLVKIVAGVDPFDRNALIARIREGLHYASLDRFGEAINMNSQEVGDILDIARSTLQRRKTSGFLNPSESDRLIRFAALRDKAVELMNGDEQAANTWLNEPKPILNSETPLAHAATEIGARDVEDLIGRLQHGVFS